MSATKSIATTFLFCAVLSAAAQVGISTQTPDPSSELEISASDKGILIPRLASQDLVNSPAEGLMIYNTTESKFYYYNGSNWLELNPWDYRQGSNSVDEDNLIMEFNNDRFIGIDANSPDSKLSIAGNAAIGTNYSNNNAAPVDGLLVEGNVGIGVTNPGVNSLEVNGASEITGDVTINGTLTATFGSVSIGTIIMWSGNPAALPPGWLLCDGSATYTDFFGDTRTVPDLRGRFIAGYDVSDADHNAIGDIGGSKTVVLTVADLPAHNHGGSTSTNGNHNHTVTDQYRPTTLINGTDLNRQGVENSLTSVTRTTSSAGNHSHTISSQGGGNAHENTPPFYTLAYIIRIQ
ncbi:MAG: tail fiber protein [Bacteroidota bacterium]